MTAKSFKLCINTQTPLIRQDSVLLEQFWIVELESDPLDLLSLKESVDYDSSPGGVTTMAFPAVKRLIQHGIVNHASWISLAPNAPSRIECDGIHFQNI